jgi:hypothetical protein
MGFGKTGFGKTRFGLQADRAGWSELIATNAPVEDEPVEPVSRMIISLPALVFFFPDPPCPKILYQKFIYLPPPTYQLPPASYLPPTSPTPPHSIARARVVERKLELWSCCCGVVELCSSCGVGARAAGVRVGVRAPTRPTHPRSGKMLTFFFFWCVCFV